MVAYLPEGFRYVNDSGNSAMLAKAYADAVGNSKPDFTKPIRDAINTYYDAKRDEKIAGGVADIFRGIDVGSLDPTIITAKAIQDAAKTKDTSNQNWMQIKLAQKRLEADLAKDARARAEDLWVSKYLEQNQNNAGLRDVDWINENRKSLEKNPGALRAILKLSTGGMGDWNNYDSMSDTEKANVKNLTDTANLTRKELEYQQRINELVGQAPGTYIDAKGNVQHISKNEYIEKQLKPIVEKSGGNLADAVENFNKALLKAKTVAEKAYKARTSKDGTGRDGTGRNVSFSEDEVLHYLTATGYDPLLWRADFNYKAEEAGNALAAGYDSRARALAELTQITRSLQAAKAAKTQVQAIDSTLEGVIARIKNNPFIPENQKAQALQRAINRSLYQKQALFTKNSDLDKRTL